MSEKPAEDAKFLFDPYLDWVANEGPPVVEGLGVDLFAVDTKPWPRLGADGADGQLPVERFLQRDVNNPHAAFGQFFDDLKVGVVRWCKMTGP